MQKDKEYYIKMITERIEELKRALLKESRPVLQDHLRGLLKTNRDWLIYVSTGKGELVRIQTRQRYTISRETFSGNS